MMRGLALLLLLAASVSGASAAPPLGRLFFTPAERAALDVTRMQKRVPEKPTLAEPAPEAPPAPQMITYDGLVRRSDGKSTLWLNSKPFDEREGLSGLAVTGRVRPDGGVTLQVPETGARINLRVGQRAELHTGRVAEGRPPKQETAQKTEPAAQAEAKAEPADKPAPSAPGSAPPRPAESPPERKADPATATAPRDGISSGRIIAPVEKSPGR